ncbi:hypothetical protein CDAR_36071 [Caerostris darwini]|uniref:Uncharacterized protein n=1 Tax=Caerostris darwini TaxID=1538125 RepID=A0AAV4VBX0_9ARAC|nr:hypothetical protein CDAR_36071 [Caerostris darwini]
MKEEKYNLLRKNRMRRTTLDQVHQALLTEHLHSDRVVKDQNNERKRWRPSQSKRGDKTVGEIDLCTCKYHEAKRTNQRGRFKEISLVSKYGSFVPSLNNKRKRLLEIGCIHTLFWGKIPYGYSDSTKSIVWLFPHVNV